MNQVLFPCRVKWALVGNKRRYILIFVGLMNFLGRLGYSQSEQLLPQHVWGAASNGMCVGVVVRKSDWPDHQNDFYCDVNIKNLTTNRLYIYVPPFKERYDIRLYGPDGGVVRQLQPWRWSQKNPWLVREPIDTDSLSERRNLDWFFLKETFDVRTNGQYTLIASVRVNAFTNFAASRSQMRKAPTYFLLPAATNTFELGP